MIYVKSNKLSRFRKAITCGFVVYLFMFTVACGTIPDNTPKTNVQMAENPVIGKVADVDDEQRFAIIEFYRSMLPPKTLIVKDENYETVSVLNLPQEIKKRMNIVAYDIQEGNPSPNDRLINGSMK